ncbi:MULTISPECIES: host attachment family protein [Phaeobacter]|uniref:Protein required for attachment to host cell n=2 Tax=Phaeobacter TaxID=302485 RepID=A0AAD0ECQ3_9RHOB|nr:MULTISPECIES: host attachment family protein [Phaeobacter]AHD09248.1 Protein required for attachment to host cell [Phaeobacter gallaeciensis DSM 26640]ATE92511.1 Protein required for attachment to host cell [Phaeobacter gallaeciensis]ATE97667.1 Protein required for attachment to host cell [Phaeobacter gallaeciensis]ATF01176.1 Protein required for attachment to host cell [Phaeobacter gallaeciensis]ATF05556.1 Protein required for attachment to host cell [Phaeobacter gallaeciensis]
MAQLDHGTFVLVTDSEKALLLQNTTDAQNPHLEVRRKEEQDNPSDIDQSANRPGRMHDGGPGQRSALDDTDWHELAKERFADDIADLLYERAHKGKLGNIVLVASPQVLGNLRGKLHKEVQDLVTAEIPKTLTNHPIDEIEKIVQQELAA